MHNEKSSDFHLTNQVWGLFCKSFPLLIDQWQCMLKQKIIFRFKSSIIWENHFLQSLEDTFVLGGYHMCYVIKWSWFEVWATGFLGQDNLLSVSRRCFYKWGAGTLKMISSPFCAVSVLNVCEPHTKECESMLFVKKYVPYLRNLSNSFFNSFIDFYSCEVFSWSNMRKNEVLSFDRFASIMAVVFKLWIYFM